MLLLLLLLGIYVVIGDIELIEMVYIKVKGVYIFKLKRKEKRREKKKKRERESLLITTFFYLILYKSL